MKRFAVLGTRLGWHCQEVLRAFERRGAEADFVTIDRLVCPLGMQGAKLPLFEYDGVMIRGIPAGSLEQVIYRMDALFALERAGLLCVNSPKTIEKTVDKFLTSRLLEEAGLPVPPTICCETADSALESFAALGGDVVYKPLFGSCGNGLLRLQTAEEAKEAFTPLAEAGSVLYMQQFIPSGNSDIRAFVIGGRVVASMRRRGKDWRANVSKGGTAEAYKIDIWQETLALAAAGAVNAAVAGVDLLVSESGETYVTEVNGCPGWQGLSTVTDVNIADEMVSLFF